MGVRPPPSSDDDEPDTVAFGIAALDARLEETPVDFPATSDELRRALGDADIPYDAAGNTVRFETALDEAPREQFESRQELLNVLHPVFENRRRSSSTGIIAQFRSLLPF